MNRLLSLYSPFLPWLLLIKLAIKLSPMVMEQHTTLPSPMYPPTMPLITMLLQLITDLPLSIISQLLLISLPLLTSLLLHTSLPQHISLIIMMNPQNLMLSNMESRMTTPKLISMPKNLLMVSQYFITYLIIFKCTTYTIIIRIFGQKCINILQKTVKLQ